MKFLAVVFVICFGALVSPVLAQESSIIATVNDKPVTDFDITTRINLLKLLGDTRPQDRKKIANELIDDVIKIDEATKLKINPTEKEIDERLDGVAKSLKTDVGGLKSKFAGQGVTEAALMQFFSAQLSFGRLMSIKYHEHVDVSDAEVDKKFAAVNADINGKIAKIESDPRRQPIKVYSLLQIDLPVEGADPQLLQSRAIEAQQIVGRLKSCSGARAAASGIFNVQIGKQIEADGKKLPPQLKAGFDKAGVGHGIGPVRGPKGLQVLAFCGTRMIIPPKINAQRPTRDQIKNMALNEKFDQIKNKYSAVFRKTAIIEYKDQSYAP